ncbi:MAG: HEAT repeat domain-containing protein [Candidatus Sumerlaeaceae bacterium]
MSDSSEPTGISSAPGPLSWSHRGGGARVDDCLLERYQLRDRLSTLLDAVPPNRRPARRVLRAMALETRAAGEQSASALLDLYLSERAPRREEVARLILQGLPRPLVDNLVRQAMESPATSEVHKEKLTALGVALAKAHADAPPQRFVPPTQIQYTAAELVEAYLEAVEEAQATEPEAIGLVWLRGFRGLPDAFRVQVLRALAERRDPLFMPVLETEARNDSVEVRRTVAGVLGNLRVQEALDLAMRMEFDVDVMVRYDAGRAAEQLRKGKRLPRAVAAPVFDRCFCLAVPGVGAAGILYAARAADGTIKFCSLLLDTWHRGVVDAWGNVGCDESQFAEVVLAFSAEVSHVSCPEVSRRVYNCRPQFLAITRAEALELIRNSVMVSRSRGRRLPAEFPLWERLFRYENEEEHEISSEHANIVDEFVFDLHCAACNRRIAVNRTRTNLSVSGGYAFCSKCLAKQRVCSSCGKPYRLASISAKRILAAFDESTCTRCVSRTARAASTNSA